MGRYLSCSVVTKIEITEKNGAKSKIIENKDEVLKQLNRYIDTNNYELVEYLDALDLELKLDVFNKNINSLFDELDTIVHCKEEWLYNLQEEKISVKLNRYDDNYNYESNYERERNIGRFYITTEKDQIDDYQTYPFANYWIFHGNREMQRNLTVRIHIISLWSYFSKYVGEDEYNLLHIINILKNSYFKTPLSGSIIICIEG